MQRRTSIFTILILILIWPVLTAANIIPPLPSSPPLRLILGVERVSETVWMLLVGCHYPPHDLRVWTNETQPKHPQTITALAPSRWKAQFTGPLPLSATVYGCGQSAALVVATTAPPPWLNSLFGLGIGAAVLLGARLVRRPRHKSTSPNHPTAPTTQWHAQIHDEQGERTIRLPTGLLSIGSDPACHLIVLAPDIALRHAHLMLTEKQAHIVDLASPSGVFSGPVRRRLRPNTPTPVGDEDIWLGATVRLRIGKSYAQPETYQHRGHARDTVRHAQSHSDAHNV